MDRRMYRGNMGNNWGSRNVSQCRQNEPVCGDIGGRRVEEDICEKRYPKDTCEKERQDGDFGRFPIAMCYVPWQCFRNLYENEFAALANGTLFKELDLKWYGRGCK